KGKLAVHPVGRLVARVVLRAGAGVEEAVVESDVYDLATGARLSDDLAGAFRDLEAGRVEPADPADAGKASTVPAREPGDLLRLLLNHLQEKSAERVAARRAAARVRARAPRAVQRPAVPQRWVGLGARVSALRSFAHGPGDLPARPLRLRGVLVSLLGLCRGLLQRPRYRAVSRGRATGVRRARARLSVVPLAALHGPRRGLRRGRAHRLLGVPRTVRQLRPGRVQPARRAERRGCAEGKPASLYGVRQVL